MDFRTDRLMLRAIDDAGLPALAELLQDDVVKQTYMVPDFASSQEALDLAKRLQMLSQTPGRNLWGICLGDSLIGIMNETEINGDQIEIGYAILPRYFNQGFATEALQGVINHLLKHGFSRVIAGAFEENLASIRVMVKCGMTRLDRQDTIEYRGKTHRCVYYSADTRPD